MSIEMAESARKSSKRHKKPIVTPDYHHYATADTPSGFVDYRKSAKQFEQTPTPGNVYKPKQAADVEDEDIFANIEDVVAFYDKNPPKRVRIGSDW